MSETRLCRDRLSKFCEGVGLDLGFGGDPIVPTAICLDIVPNCIRVGNCPQHITGDARNLQWFKDDSLDYVYSSHLLEDFKAQETLAVLNEWLRVIKIGGFLILFLPDIDRYNSHCELAREPKNPNHRNQIMSLDFMRDQFNEIEGVEIVHELDDIGYSFEIVVRKIK